VAGAAADLDFQRSATGVSLFIHVSPRSRREGVGGVHGDALRVAVRAVPAAGAANAAVAGLLAKTLGVPRASVELDARSKNRRKRVRIAGDADVLATQLLELAAGKASQ